MDLGGTWAAIEATEDHRRTYAQPDAPDDDWLAMPVPSHWRSHPDLGASDGSLLYRRRFTAPAPAPGQRRFLVFDGLFYQGDVWLDGAYVGNTEGYFVPHRFEVTEALAAREEHLVAVELACSPQPDRRNRRNLTGALQHGHGMDASWNPGGIWRPVHIESSGPVRITRFQVLCTEADETRAVLQVRAELDTVEARTAHVRAVVTPHGTGRDTPVAALFEEQPLAAGANQVTWTVAVDDPALWWPRALGAQPLYDLTVMVTVDGAPSDERTVRTGLRRLALRDWLLSVNGERLFLKGSNHGPTRRDLGAASAEELAADVDLAVAAGLDLLRVHAHVSRPELYAAADAAGLLLWQDLPLQWSHARGVRTEAVRQARAAVELLGHHPSVALWCGHDEPFTRDAHQGEARERRRTRRRVALAQELPSWNRTVLDRSVKRALEKADGTRPVIAHSGVLPHLPTLDGTDSHLWLGWSRGDERDLPRLAARFPRLVRFVSEFGAQAVPPTADFCRPERWPDLDWQHLEEAHGMERSVLLERVPVEGHATFASWQAATQAYQAEVVGHQIEELRRLKYRPAGGFAQFSWADCQPAISCSVLDHERRPKAAHAALVAACRPVIVVADRLPATVAPGQTLALDVHVVSDLRVPLESCVVHAELSWDGGAQQWSWAGDVPADSCVRVATLPVVVPDAPGALALDLTVEALGVAAASAQRSVVEGPPEG